MIQITPHMRILVAIEPIDFRAGIDGLAAACRKRLEADPFSGALFVFRNRARTAIKVLVYDGQGFWVVSGKPAAAPRPTRALEPFFVQLRAARVGRDASMDAGIRPGGGQLHHH